MTVVARTFSGAQIDGTFTYNELYPSVRHADLIPAFQKVREWWNWMCENNRDVALKTDMLAFFLYAGDAWRRQNSSDRRFKDRKDVITVDHLFSLNQIFRHFFTSEANNDGAVIKAQKQASLTNNRSYHNASFIVYALHIRADKVRLIIYLGTPEANDKIEHEVEICTPQEDLPLWAHECVDKITPESGIASLYDPRLSESDILKILHATHVKEFSRELQPPIRRLRADVDFDHLVKIENKLVLF
jgi:hypothetical protein